MSTNGRVKRLEGITSPLNGLQRGTLSGLLGTWAFWIKDSVSYTMLPVSLRTALVVVLLSSFGYSLAATVGQQPASKSVWDGVYTPAQGARGEEAYKADCASCHGDMLDGSGQAPPLSDREFKTNWNDTPLFDLFDRLHATMPADRPGQLSRERIGDILAFLLKANGFPAGTQELPTGEDALKTIRFVSERPAK